MRTGFAKADITPHIGDNLCFIPNFYMVDEVTKLYSRAMALENDGILSVIVSVEVISIIGESYDEIITAICNATGLSSKHVFLNSTHTHSAPYLSLGAQRYLNSLGLDSINEDYHKNCVEIIVICVKNAICNLQTSFISTSVGSVLDTVSNRRIILEDGTVYSRFGRLPDEKMRAYPDGLIDNKVTGIWLRDENGKLLGSLINFACHSTVFANYFVTCHDISGEASTYMEENEGGICLYLQGCAGNMSPGKYAIETPILDMQRLGKNISTAALDSQVNPIRALSVKVTSDIVLLDIRINAPIEQLVSNICNYANTFKKDFDMAIGTELMSLSERLYIRKKFHNQIPVEIKLLKVGELMLFFLPGEVFIQASLDLKKHFCNNIVAVISYGDCLIQYVPDKLSYSLPSEYESSDSWCNTKPGTLDRLIKACIELGER